MNGDAELWLRSFRPRPGARVRLVCLPHAGGNAAFYRPWATALPAWAELVAVQYPGRQDRLDEPCVEDMDTMAALIADALVRWVRGPLALFGHSMGGVIAFEVARRLEVRPGRGPQRLFISGRQPAQYHRRVTVDLGDDDALWAELRRLGGTGGEALDNPVLRTLALPAIRGDYRLVDRYRPGPARPLSTPITALVGDVDPEVTVAEAAGWRQHTADDFVLRVLPGDHFYLVPQHAAVLREVAEGLAAVPVRDAGP